VRILDVPIFKHIINFQHYYLRMLFYNGDIEKTKKALSFLGVFMVALAGPYLMALCY